MTSASARARARAIVALAGAVALLGGIAAAGLAARAASPRPLETVVANGRVELLLRHGARVYAAGRFNHLGPDTGSGVVLNPRGGQVRSGLPRVEGAVVDAVPDGAGGFFIGGAFTRVARTSRRYLAHILAGGALDATFNPAPNGPVLALALASGRLYVGGAFNTIGGRSRTRLAALDPLSGAVDPDFEPFIGFGGAAVRPTPPRVAPALPALPLPSLSPPNAELIRRLRAFRFGPRAPSCDRSFTGDGVTRPRGGVLAIAASGSRVYIGGSFSSVNGFKWDNLAALDARTGEIAREFDPDANSPGFDPNANERRVDVNDTVIALALGGGRLYAGGIFTSVAGRSRNRLAALDARTGALVRGFDPAPNGSVLALAASGQRVYAGGRFSFIGGARREAIASLDPVSGLADPAFAASAGDDVESLAVGDGRLYLAGRFERVNGARRNRLASLDPATGALDRGFDPNADNHANVVSAGEGGVFAGGVFDSVGGVSREGLAALSVDDGRPDASFDPGTAVRVRALAAAGRRLYVAGAFADGRRGVFALSTASGRRDSSFRSPASRPPSALAVKGPRLYASEVRLRGERRRRTVAALDARSGRPLRRFRTRVRGTVNALAVQGRRLLLAGKLVDRRVRVPVARDAGEERAGAETTRVRTILTGLLALDRFRGFRLRGFRPRVRVSPFRLGVTRVVPAGGRIYLAGQFKRAGRVARRNLVALRGATGALDRRFHPPRLFPSAIALQGRRLYVNASPRSGNDMSALDARTGALVRGFAPAVRPPVCALAAAPRRVFGGGAFERVGGHRHPRLAAFALEGG